MNEADIRVTIQPDPFNSQELFDNYEKFIKEHPMLDALNWTIKQCGISDKFWQFLYELAPIAKPKDEREYQLAMRAFMWLKREEIARGK